MEFVRVVWRLGSDSMNWTSPDCVLDGRETTMIKLVRNAGIGH
jgi:hypothetical protein